MQSCLMADVQLLIFRIARDSNLVLAPPVTWAGLGHWAWVRAAGRNIGPGLLGC